MAFHNPVTVELFDKNDNIIMPVTRPISITHNIEAHSFDYSAVMVEVYDELMRKLLRRWADGELIQYRITGRFGVSTGDVNSLYAYDQGRSGEFAFYGRSHKELLSTVLGFPQPSNSNAETQTTTHAYYSGSALSVMCDVLRDNVVNRIGLPMQFPTGDLGNHVTIDFRFDEIHRHFYTDSKDRGGVLLKDNGNIVFDIHRDFDAHTYVLTAREPTHHEQMIEVRSGRIERWQFTTTRAEADRIIVGGPGEMLQRHFADIKRPAPQHRRFPAEMFTEDTSPDTGAAVGTDPTKAQIMTAISKFGEGKLDEYADKSAVSGQLLETETFFLGGAIKPGDWVKIGIDSTLPLGEQEIDKAIITWSRENGYLVDLTRPSDTETTEAATLNRLISAVRELATRTRRL